MYRAFITDCGPGWAFSGVRSLHSSPNQGRKSSITPCSITGRVQGLTGLCSQGLEHLLCICLDLWPSFKLPSKETHCALYIKHSWCTTQIPITGQVTNHVHCMFGLLRAHSCTFLQRTALDQWEPPHPEKPGGLQTMTGTAIQNLVTLLQDTATLKLFMLQGLQRDQAEARCQLKLHLCFFPYTILAFLTPLQVSSEHIPSVDYLHKIPLPGSGWKLIKDTFVHQTRCLQ